MRPPSSEPAGQDGGSEAGAVAICNLLYRYAELIDSGRFEEIADGLFAHARLIVGPPGVPALDGRGMLAVFRRTTILHADGTPRTRHVVTNPIVELDAGGTRATCRSCYSVFQQTESLPLQVIACGRYHDVFEKVDGEWRFAERDYTLLDLVGDVSQHLRIDPARAKGQ